MAEPLTLEQMDALQAGGVPRYGASGSPATKLSPSDEREFQSWYADAAKKTGMNADPDNPLHFYDMRGAWKSGVRDPVGGHWPSQFKEWRHPNRFVNGEDTITGERLPRPLTLDEMDAVQGGAPATSPDEDIARLVQQDAEHEEKLYQLYGSGPRPAYLPDEQRPPLTTGQRIAGDLISRGITGSGVGPAMGLMNVLAGGKYAELGEEERKRLGPSQSNLEATVRGVGGPAVQLASSLPGFGAAKLAGGLLPKGAPWIARFISGIVGFTAGQEAPKAIAQTISPPTGEGHVGSAAGAVGDILRSPKTMIEQTVAAIPELWRGAGLGRALTPAERQDALEKAAPLIQLGALAIIAKSPAKATEIAGKDSMTRADAESLGLPIGSSGGDRAAIHREIQGAIATIKERYPGATAAETQEYARQMAEQQLSDFWKARAAESQGQQSQQGPYTPAAKPPEGPLPVEPQQRPAIPAANVPGTEGQTASPLSVPESPQPIPQAEHPIMAALRSRPRDQLSREGFSSTVHQTEGEIGAQRQGVNRDIESLGSVSAVAEGYPGNTPVERYARAKAAIMYIDGKMDLGEPTQTQLREHWPTNPQMLGHPNDIADKPMEYQPGEIPLEEGRRPAPYGVEGDSDAGASQEQAAQALAQPQSLQTPGVLNRVLDAVGWWHVSRGLRASGLRTMPLTTKFDQPTAEAVVRAGSAKAAGKVVGQSLAADVLGADGMKDVNTRTRLGAVYVEENLRGIRRSALARLHRAESPEESAQAQKDADAVGTIIGADRSPFATEADFEAAKRDLAPLIEKHKQVVEPFMDTQHRLAGNMAEDAPLENRSPEVGFQHLLDIGKQSDTTVQPISGGGKGNPMNVQRRKGVFFRKATGAGNYDMDYVNQVANGVARETYAAKLNEAYRVGKAQGVIQDIDPSARGQQPTIRSEPTKTLQISGIGARKAEFVAVPESLYGEWHRALNLDYPEVPDLFKKGVFGGLTRATIIGPAEALAHTMNQLGVAQNTPSSPGGGAAYKMIRGVGGPQRIAIDAAELYSIHKSLAENDPQTMNDLRTVFEIGAGRQGFERSPGFIGKIDPSTYAGKLLHSTDLSLRVALLRRFKALAADGIVENSETALREFINQLGQYQTQFQPWWIRIARATGLGPFTTASATMLGNQARRLVPVVRAYGGVPAESVADAARLKLSAYTNLAGYIGTVSLANYALTGKMSGRSGTPIGYVDTGQNDKNGNRIQVDLLSLGGFRRGLNFTGASAADWARRVGATPNEAASRALDDASGAIIHSVLGPPGRFAFTAATGKTPDIHLTQAAKVVPSGNPLQQHWENLKAAGKGLNPVMMGGPSDEASRGAFEVARTVSPGLLKSVPSLDRQKSLLAGGRFAASRDAVDDAARRARKTPDPAAAFLAEITTWPPEQRAKQTKEIQTKLRGLRIYAREQKQGAAAP